jgi:hypothetical protein
MTNNLDCEEKLAFMMDGLLCFIEQLQYTLQRYRIQYARDATLELSRYMSLSIRIARDYFVALHFAPRYQ